MDKDIGRDVLSKYDIPVLSNVLSKDKDEWIKTRKKVTNKMKGIGPKLTKYRKKDPASAYVKTLENDKVNLQKYNDRLKGLIDQSSLFGKGFVRQKSYKITNGGQYGGLSQQFNCQGQ